MARVELSCMCKLLMALTVCCISVTFGTYYAVRRWLDLVLTLLYIILAIVWIIVFSCTCVYAAVKRRREIAGLSLDGSDLKCSDW